MSGDIRQVWAMWRSRLWLLYWVSTTMRRKPALTRLDSTKSISRYTPPKGTAGFARSRVSGERRLPSPPARTIDSTRSVTWRTLPRDARDERAAAGHGRTDRAPHGPPAGRPARSGYRPKRRRRRELSTTDTELNAIAAPAMMGDSSPAAASGIAATL